MSEKWKKVGFEILKYAVGAILGALGLSVSGCISLPVFNF